MEDNKFWLSIYKYAAIVVSIGIATIGGCSMNKHRIMAEMIKDGVDPIKASCAVYAGDTETHKSICAIAAIPK